MLKGLPAVDYSARDIIYRPRNVRAHRVYGYSPVQQVLMTVNIALRRQVWQLDYYSEGSIPDALIGVPAGWTPDQIKQFQDYWDTEFAGDLARRRKAKFVPGDTAVKIQQTKEPEQKNDFDEWLARIICYAFSVPPQWAVKAMNRATADNQSAQAEDEGLEPTKEWVKDLVDQIIAEEFSSPDLELVWLAEGDDDLGKNEAALEARVKLGALTLNELRDSLGLDPYTNAAADRPMVLTPTGYVPIEAGVGANTAATNVNRPSREVDACGAGDWTKPVLKAAADDPEHPGWPAGTADGKGGQFRPKETVASGGSSGPNSDSRPVQYAALETGTNTDAAIAPRGVDGPSDQTERGDQYAAVTVERYDRTGNPIIDRTTDVLFQTLVRYVELADRAQILLGKAGPPLFGTMVHVAFALDVKAQDLPGIGENGVEQSFSEKDVVKYGADGSIRTDVIMRDANGRVIAIWDVKTGSAELTDARREEIREEVGVSDDVPVIELHIKRGARF